MLPTTKTVPKSDFLTTTTCLVGLPKVGKSTFASQLGDNVLFLCTEKGHDFLSIFKMDINNWNDFMTAYKLLMTTQHEFRTIVIDVVDHLIKMAEDEIVKTSNPKVDHIDDYKGGFQRGQDAARSLMAPLFLGLRNKGFGITFITHPKEKEYKSEAMSWTATATNLVGKYENFILSQCDLVLYIYVNAANQRVVRTKPNKFVQCAGDRSNKLPEIMPLDAKLVIETLKKPLEVKTEVAKQVQVPPQQTQNKTQITQQTKIQ